MAVIIPVVSKFDDKGLKQAQSAFAGLGSSMKGILGAAGIAVGFSAIASGLKDSAKAAIEDTKSQALLANQLRNTVGASESQIASVEKSIKAMQLQASVADDVIRPAFASLVRSTGDVGQATALTSLALDVAAGTGKDLGAVSLALGKAVNGSSTALIKLVPSIKGASDPMGVLAKQFDGAAEAAANNDPIQRLNTIFGEMQETIGTALIPVLQDMASYFASDEGQKDINDTATGIKNLTTGFINFGKAVSQVVDSSGIGYLFAILTGDFSKADELLANIGIGTKQDKTSIARSLQEAQGRFQVLGKTGSSAFSDFFPKPGPNDKPNTKKIATDYVKEFGTNLADEMRKQMATIRLQNKGLSEGLIESIIGSGAGWYKVYQSILNSSDTALGRLQKNWNATSAGVKELEGVAKAAADAATAASEAAAAAAKEASDKAIAAAEDAVAKAEDAVSKLGALADEARSEVDKFAKYFTPLPPTVTEVYDAAVENLARLQEESKKTLDDMAAGMADIRAEVNKSAQSFKNLAKTAEPIGAWESKVNDSFANITASAQKAFDNKLITEDAYKNLMAYAGREQKLLTDIAKQRDALAEKISLAKALYSDTRSAVISFGNITGLLKQQAQTVTETTSKIIDGVAVTIQRSVEKISSTNLVDEYKNILQKTRDFASNLNALKSMGLNKDLFKQIVDAGVDVGGQTAAALAEGGPAVVGELNGLFAELQTVGDQVAETTTVVMYNNGKDVVGGFINGLLAEDAGLAAAATTIATLFADTFKVMLDGAMKSVFDAMKSQLDAAIAAAKAAVDAALVELKKAQSDAIDAARIANLNLKKAEDDAAKKKQALIDLTAPTVPVPEIITLPNPSNSSTNNNVNNGVTNVYIETKTTDPNEIVRAIATYTKRNGSIMAII